MGLGWFLLAHGENQWRKLFCVTVKFQLRWNVQDWLKEIVFRRGSPFCISFVTDVDLYRMWTWTVLSKIR